MSIYELLKQAKDQINAAQTLLASFERGASLANVHLKQSIDLLFFNETDKSDSFVKWILNSSHYTEAQKQKLVSTWNQVSNFYELSNSSPDIAANYSWTGCQQLLEVIRDLYDSEFLKVKDELPKSEKFFYSPKLISIFYLPLITYIILYIYFGSANPTKWLYNPLDDFTVEFARQDFGTLKYNKSVSDGQLRINGKYYASGFGTHANSIIKLKLNKKASKLSGLCGVDDATQGNGSIRCIVGANGRQLYASAFLMGNTPPSEFEVNIENVDEVELLVSSGPDGIASDHANWVNLTLK